MEHTWSQEKQAMQRRSFLKGAGVVTVMVAGGGVWRAFDQGVFSAGAGPAYLPWENWRKDPDEGLLALVRAAILAASPHNTQPWLFKVTDASIEMYLDTRRNVGALDPYLREAYIGMGCALENLMLAAVAKGSAINVTLVPGKLGLTPAEPNPVLVARVDIAACVQELDELYEAIPRRHTNRGLFLPRKQIPPPFIDDLSRLAGDEPDVRLFLITAEADRRKFVAISSAASTELYSDPEVIRANERWLRLQWREVQEYRDGLTIDAFGLPPFMTGAAKMMPSWMLRRAAASGAKSGYSDLMSSAPLIGIIAVHDRHDREQCLRAGRIWQRAHLLATARGLAGRPCNEAVEMIDHEQALGRTARRAGMLAETIGDRSWQPTFVFYMGYPTLAARASPRRPIEKVVL
jgi:nitroreductase